MAPEQYRVHSSTSLQMYHATFDVVAALNANPPPLALKQTPILLILAEDDEVVDSPEVADFFTSNKFSAITNLRVVPEPLLKHSFNHLIVDENTLGAEEWRRVSNAISGFLRASFVNPP
jgi:alpha-beta hydrolase superfamily lysophospholipase